jgi:HD-GYP domain-containing protein (c-di-GMP phosphodiesterase class II)
LQRHCINVSLLNGLIGNWLELPPEIVESLILAGLVHDCGKASIPEQILNAPRKLSLAEYEIIKMHSEYGNNFLADFPAEVRHGVQGHHEKYGGYGYPFGAKKDEISFAARVTAVSDIYDAMVSHRAYKTPLNPFHIISSIRELIATELDPMIVETFARNMPHELVGKPVMLSNGEIGAIHSIDPDDLEFPFIRTGKQIIKSSRDLSCIHMYFDNDKVF